MCVCLFVSSVSPLLFLFKVNISWVSSFWMFLTSQWPVVCPLCPACSISRCAQHSFQTSLQLQISVCACIYKCVYIYCVYIGVCMCVHASSSSVVFYLFSFQSLHEVMNAWVWFFFLPPPPPLPPSHASSLFYSVGFFGLFLVCYYIWFIFYFASLLPPQPLPPFLWQRVGIDQGDSPDLTQVSLHLISISQSTSQSTSI